MNEIRLKRLENRIKPPDKFGTPISIVDGSDGFRLLGSDRLLTGEEMEEIRQSPAVVIEVDEDDAGL